MNALYNFQDEWGKLRDYRVLKNYLKLDDGGAYFYIEKGIRTYEFDSIDGFLIPIWHGVDTYSSFPDHTRTKKIKIQADLRFQKEIAGYKMDTKLFNYGALFFAINMFVLIILIFGGVKLYGAQKDISDEYNDAEIICMQSTVRLNQQYGKVIEDAMNLQREIISQNRIEDIIKRMQTKVR